MNHVGKAHVEAGGLVAFGGYVSPATYRFGGSRQRNPLFRFGEGY
jgi:hypothetical protein